MIYLDTPDTPAATCRRLLDRADRFACSGDHALAYQVAAAAVMEASTLPDRVRTAVLDVALAARRLRETGESVEHYGTASALAHAGLAASA